MIHYIMEDNKLNKEFSSESISDLIVQLRAHKNAGYSSSMKWYNRLKAHLAERDLSDEERKLVDHIDSTDRETLTVERNMEFVPKEKDTPDQQTSYETEKYPALKTIAGIYVILSAIVGLASVAAAIYFSTRTSDTGIIIGVSIIVGGAITVLLLAAASELIKLFIDIEHNTRQVANRT